MGLIRGAVFLVLMVGLVPVAKRVWAHRKDAAVAPTLRYERLEVAAIVVFLGVAVTGLGLIYLGFSQLGVGLVFGSVASGVVGVYAHIMRKLS